MHTNNTRVSLEIVSTGMYSIIITLISRHVIYTSVLCYYVRDWGGVSASTDVAGSLTPIIAIRSSILDPRSSRTTRGNHEDDGPGMFLVCAPCLVVRAAAAKRSTKAF